MDFEKFENVLYEAHTLCSEIPPKEKTFMEISGYPHLENVVSNIIVFYLNPNEEHDLNDIVLKSLLQVFKNKTNYDYNELDFSTISTFREYMTLKGNRIDIVLQSNEIVIGIENKIKFWNGEDLSTTCYAVFDIGCNLDVKLDIDGWKIGIFVWKKAHQLKIKEMLNQSGFSFDEENNHLWLFEYNYNCDTQIIVEKAEKIYKLLENIE